MSTATAGHPDCRLHDMGEGHRVPAAAGRDPRLPARDRAEAALDARSAPLADLKSLALAHESHYVQELQDLLEQVAASGESRAAGHRHDGGPGTWRGGAAGGRGSRRRDRRGDRRRGDQCDSAPCARRSSRDAAKRWASASSTTSLSRPATRAGRARPGGWRSTSTSTTATGTEDIVAGDDRVLMVSIFQHRCIPTAARCRWERTCATCRSRRTPAAARAR